MTSSTTKFEKTLLPLTARLQIAPQALVAKSTSFGNKRSAANTSWTPPDFPISSAADSVKTTSKYGKDHFAFLKKMFGI